MSGWLAGQIGRTQEKKKVFLYYVAGVKVASIAYGGVEQFMRRSFGAVDQRMGGRRP